jgi:hypothetical protein
VLGSAPLEAIVTRSALQLQLRHLLDRDGQDSLGAEVPVLRRLTSTPGSGTRVEIALPITPGRADGALSTAGRRTQ